MILHLFWKRIGKMILIKKKTHKSAKIQWLLHKATILNNLRLIFYKQVKINPLKNKKTKKLKTINKMTGLK